MRIKTTLRVEQTDRSVLPCNAWGLPPRNVAITSCELLPRSFHPYPNGRFCFCGTFPKLSLGCR